MIHTDGTLGRKIANNSFSCWNVIPSGYIHSNHRVFELDGSTNYENHASLKVIIELSQKFESFSEEDIDALKIQTKSLISDHNIDYSDIRTLTVNSPFIEDRNHFKSGDWNHAYHRSYQDWNMISSMNDDGYTRSRLPETHSYRDDSCTHIELVFNPSFEKISELFCGMSKWFVYNLSTGPQVGKLDYNYQSNCDISCLGGENETGTDYSRRYLEYTKNACIWGLLDCNCSSTGGTCLKVQNEGPNRSWYGFGLDSGKIVGLGTVNTLEERMNCYIYSE